MGIIQSCKSRNNTHQHEATEDDPLIQLSDDNYNYCSRRQKLAIAGLILSDFLRCIAFRSLAIWLPLKLRLYDPFFAPEGKLKLDAISKSFQLVPIVSGFVQSLCAVFGLVSDSCVRKTKMLLIGTVAMWFCFTYIAGAMLEAGYKLHCNQTRHLDGKQYPHCEFDKLISMGGRSEGKDLLMIYMFVIIMLTCFKCMLVTAIPALAGDQMREREALKPLYTSYPWFWTLGDTAAILFCSSVGSIRLEYDATKITEVARELQSKFCVMFVCIAGITLAASTLSTLVMFSVIFSKSVREPRSDISVIVDTFSIWKQAWKRRHQLKRGEAFLSTAAHKNGGDFPEQAVNEREHFGKYFLVMLCMLPLSYSIWLPLEYKSTAPSMYENGTHLKLVTDQDGIMINMIQQGTSLVVIPAIYAFSYILRRTWGIKINLLHRIVAGLCSMIIALICYESQKGKVYSSKLNFIFQGMSNAFIFTAGYELAIVSAPRSMQATAMGVFYSMYDFPNLVRIAVNQSPGATFTRTYSYVGVILDIISIVLLLIIHKRWHIFN